MTKKPYHLASGILLLLATFGLVPFVLLPTTIAIRVVAASAGVAICILLAIVFYIRKKGRLNGE